MSGDGAVLIIRIRPVFSISTQPNMNTLFSLLFRPNRIQTQYFVQHYKQLPLAPSAMTPPHITRSANTHVQDILVEKNKTETATFFNKLLG